jgi:glycosyltransferase involved in cell wall biosynthesis
VSNNGFDPLGTKGAHPQLSIVTLTMNEPQRLLQTMESVDRQRDVAIEHIIVNGGEPGLPSASLGTRSRRVWIDAPPEGIYSAMNVGLEMATAPAIMFVNSGDRLFRSESSRVALTLLRNARWGYGSLVAQRSGSARLKGPGLLDRWLIPLGAGYVPHPATIMETSLMRDLGGFAVEFGDAADQWQILRAWERHPPATTGVPLAVHLVDGVSADRDPDRLWADALHMRASMARPILGTPTLDALVARCAILTRRGRRSVRRIATSGMTLMQRGAA